MLKTLWGEPERDYMYNFWCTRFRYCLSPNKFHGSYSIGGSLWSMKTTKLNTSTKLFTYMVLDVHTQRHAVLIKHTTYTHTHTYLTCKKCNTWKYIDIRRRLFDMWHFQVDSNFNNQMYRISYYIKWQNDFWSVIISTDNSISL